MLLLAFSPCFFKPGLREPALIPRDYLSRVPIADRQLGGSACSAMQNLAPVGVVRGSSKLLFELGDPWQLADMATFLSGAVPSPQPASAMSIRGESAAAVPVYIDGARHMRAGMLR